MPALRTNVPWSRSRIAGMLAMFVLGGALAAASAHADDADWPRQFDSASGSFVVYQPQPEDLNGDVLTARAAFSLLKPGASNQTFGVLWFTERIEIDRDSSVATARSLDVTKVRLPGITPAEASRYEKLVEAEATRWDLSHSLAELRAGLAATERERASVAELANDPPRILFVAERAILVPYDGDPELEAIEGTSLQRVANTPYAVVFDPASRDYWLNGANLWYRARDPRGPWTAMSDAPSAVRAIVPPDTSSDDQVRGPAPRVLTATDPTELISTDGPPQYAPLVEDDLLYVTNTESDVLREVSTQALYVLLAGRWYRAPSQDGPWTYVSADRLPTSFKRIPPDSPKGSLLASVAGTDQADDAVADAEIPQTSAIRRGGSDFVVFYDGPPQFEIIEGTDMRYAVNTDAEVIFADGHYYACDQGVWYIADNPEGPWSVSDTRPLGVDDLQPSCPVYNVRYVYIYDTTPDVIYVGYLPGYIGCYPYRGTVVYGTGHRYKPWRGHHHYCPRPTTWGFHARYEPWLSRWSFGFSYSAGFLRVGSRWHPWNGRIPHHSPPIWFGPGGFRRPLPPGELALTRDRRPGSPRGGAGDRLPANIYNRPDNIGRVDRGALKLPLRQFGRPQLKPAPVPNDVFAGKDGKVYQRDTRGNWKVNSGRQWRPAQLPVAPTGTPPPSRGGAPGTAPGGAQGTGPGGAARPADRPQQRPAPGTWPPARAPQPEAKPWTPRPTPPAVSPTPGNLEREFHARERAGQKPPPGAVKPAPRPNPPKPERPKDKPQGEQKHGR